MDVTLESPGLDQLAGDMRLFVEDNAALRAIQARNVAKPVACGYGNSAAGTQLSAVTPFSVFNSDPSFAGQEFAILVFMTDEQSGRARYTIFGAPPTPDGKIGFPIYSGGVALPIVGVTAIQNFQVIAETGQTVNFAWALFR